MLIEDELIEIKWERRNKPIYTTKGYIFTKIGDTFLIKQKDLSPKSSIKVKCICDYGGEIVFVSMNTYTNRVLNNEYVQKVACEKCSRKKLHEVNLIKYGVKSTLQLDETKEKIKKTNIERYGVDNPAKSQEVKEKTKNTFIARYGVEYPSQNEEIRQKQINTTIEKYGVKYSLLNENVKEKSRKTLFDNHSAPTSKTQLYLCELLDGTLNFPAGNCSIDILFNENIAFEYDGGGHDLQVKFGNMTKEEFIQHERKREFFLKRRGYKILRFVSSRDRLPTEEILMDAINFCVDYLNNKGTNSEINIDMNYIRLGKTKIDFDFGYLVRKDKEYFNRMQTIAPTT